MDTSTQPLNPNPMEQPQVADAPTIEQQPTQEMAETVSVERLREDVQATLSRAEKTRDRINSIELPSGDSPRLQKLKQQSEVVFKKLEQLVFAMMDTERTVEDQSRLQQLTAEVKRDLKAMKHPLDTEVARASKPVAKEAPKPEPIEAEIPTTAIEPEPAIEIPEPIESREEPAKPEQRHDRDAFWAELKSKLGDRAYAADMLHKVQDQIKEEIQPQIAEVMKRIERGDKKNENPQQLISAIVELQTQLGGEEYAQKVQAMLTEWTTTPKERTLFDMPFGPVAFSKINATIGTEGLETRLKAAKSKTKGVSDKLWGMIGYSELQSLEGQKRTLLAALNVAMDKLVARMQDENKMGRLKKRKEQLTTTEENITRQIHYDNELKDRVTETESLDYEVESALRKLQQFVNDLPPQVKDALMDKYPTPLPSEVAEQLSTRDRQTYSQLVLNYESLRNAFDLAVNETNKLYTGGLANYERGLVTDALKGAQYEIEDDFSTPAEDLTTPDRGIQAEQDERVEVGEDEPVSPELVRARAVAIADWDVETRKSLAKIIKDTRRDISFSDDEDTAADQIAEFLLVQMPDSAKKTLFSIAKLRRSIETAESTEEIEDIQAQKQTLLAQLEPIIRKEDLRNPKLIGKVAEQYSSTPLEKLQRGDTTKDDIGTKTLSPEEAEIAEQHAITDTKAPEYAKKNSEFDTLTPEYALPVEEGMLPPSPQEAIDKNETLWKEARAVSTLFHDKLGAMTNSKLLSHAETWKNLRKLDGLINSEKKLDTLTDADKSALAASMVRLFNVFNPASPFDNNSSQASAAWLEPKSGAREIQDVLDALGITADQASKMAGQPENAPQESEVEVTPIPEPEAAKPRVPKKPLRTATEANAAAQRRPRKTPPRSNQSTRPPAIAA